MRMVCAFSCLAERGYANSDIFNLIEELRKKHEIHLFLLSKSKDEKNLKYYYVEPFWNRLRRNRLFFIFHILFPIKEIKRIKPDILIADSVFNISIPSYIISRILKIPLVIYCRELELEITKYLHTPLRFLHTPLRFLRRFAIRKSELVVAIDEGLKEYFEKEISKEVYLIPTSINFEEFKLKDIRSELNLPIDNKLILYMGSLLKYRRLDLLLKSFNRIRAQNLKLVLAGPRTGNIEYLKDLIEELNLKGSIILLPWLPYPLVPSLIYSCDVCVDPWPRGGAEEFQVSLKIVEYMAAGKPVLAINTKGNRFIVKNGQNGLLAEPNVQDFSKKLLLLLENSDLSNELGQNALKTIRDNRGSKITADKFEKLIRNKVKIVRRDEENRER
jgi:glycosyltransferase involved in cell wall biosynthesis